VDPTRSVLLVEDESVLARLIESILVEEGYSLTAVRDGDAALAAAAEATPDLVILDVGLPGRGGLEVCRELRRQGLRMPIVMLTARDALVDRVAGLDAGADDYIVKPFAFEELLARIRAHLRRSRNEQERLQVADLVLEPATRRAWRGTREVGLSDREFRLLEVLMRHTGMVLTRQRLLDHVWGYSADPSSNVVDIYVHYLRRKIDQGEPLRLIQTIRGAGYSVRP
jgi:two-component system, OmpR family, response regulator